MHASGSYFNWTSGVLGVDEIFPKVLKDLDTMELSLLTYFQCCMEVWDNTCGVAANLLSCSWKLTVISSEDLICFSTFLYFGIVSCIFVWLNRTN